MLSESKKKTIVLSLVFTSLVLDIIVALPFGILVFYWGWVPAFIFPSIAITRTLRWKPGGEILRGFILFLSIISLVFAGLWFILFFISQMGH